MGMTTHQNQEGAVSAHDSLLKCLREGWTEGQAFIKQVANELITRGNRQHDILKWAIE